METENLFLTSRAIHNKCTGSEHDGGDKGIHDRDVELLNKCNVVVAEVTQPSLGVGYELGRAVDMGKAILCLYRPQEDKLLSAMIRGMDNNDNLRQCCNEESSKIFGEGSVKNL